MSVLVTGGAGYIGSHVVLELLEAGEESVPDVVNFIRGDVGDEKLVTQVIAENGVDAIIHLSGSIVVPDSVRDPLGYYFNNTCKSRSLLACAVKAGLKHFLFSSSAAVYDAASQTAVTEEAELRPISPYGRSKLMTEIMLRDTAIIHPQLTRSSCLPGFFCRDPCRSPAARHRVQRAFAACRSILRAQDPRLAWRAQGPEVSRISLEGGTSNAPLMRDCPRKGKGLFGVNPMDHGSRTERRDNGRKLCDWQSDCVRNCVDRGRGLSRWPERRTFGSRRPKGAPNCPLGAVGQVRFDDGFQPCRIWRAA